MHNFYIGRRGFDQFGIDLETCKIRLALLLFCFLAHADPGVGINDIGIENSGARVVRLPDAVGRYLVYMFDCLGVKLVTGRRCDHHFHVQLCTGMRQRSSDIVAVTYKRDLRALVVFAMFLDCKHVSHRLAGMQPVRQGVNDGYCCIFGQLGDGAVLEGSRHDPIDVPAQNPCDVFYRLAFADAADIFRFDIDRTSTQVRHSDLETDSRAQAWLFE